MGEENLMELFKSSTCVTSILPKDEHVFSRTKSNTVPSYWTTVPNDELKQV